MTKLSKEKEELEALYDSMQLLGKENDMQGLILVCERIVMLAGRIGDNFKLGFAHKMKGFAYYRLNEIEKAIESYQRAELIFEEHAIVNELIGTKFSLGVLYRNRAEWKLALNVLNEALDLSIANDLLDANIYNNIGLIYKAQEDYRRALSFFSKAIESESTGQKPSLGLINRFQINCAIVLVKLKDNKRAENLFLSTNQYCLETNDFEFLINGIFGLAHLKLNEEKFLEAEKKFLEVIKLCQKHDVYSLSWETNLSLARVYKAMKRPKEQIAYLYKALAIAEKSYQSKIEEVLALLLEFHRSTKNLKEAYLVLKRLSSLSLARYEKEKIDNFLEFQKEFESAYQERLLAQRREQNLQLKRQHKELLAAINLHRNQQLRLQSLQLQLSPHFLFNAMQLIQSAILNQTPLVASDYLAQFATLMRGILKSSREQKISLEEELLLLKNYVLFENERNKHSMKVEFNLDKIENPAKLMIPSLLLQPYLTRSMRSCATLKEAGEVKLFFRPSRQLLFVHVLDNAKYFRQQNRILDKEIFIIIEGILKEKMKEQRKLRGELGYTFKILKEKNHRTYPNHVIFAFEL